MAVLAGKDGSITIGSAVGYIDNWTLNINGGVEECSQIGQDWKEFLGTVSDWSGSASGSFDPSDAGQKAIINGLGTNASASLTLTLTTGKTIIGDVIITNVSLGASHSGKVTFSCQFQGSDEPTPTL